MCICKINIEGNEKIDTPKYYDLMNTSDEDNPVKVARLTLFHDNLTVEIPAFINVFIDKNRLPISEDKFIEELSPSSDERAMYIMEDKKYIGTVILIGCDSVNNNYAGIGVIKLYNKLLDLSYEAKYNEIKDVTAEVLYNETGGY